MTAHQAAERYVAWLVRRGVAILVAATLLFGIGAYLAAFHLPLRADFSHLLPEDAPSVRALRRLEARVSSQDTLLVVVAAADPAVRARVAAAMTERIRALPPALVSRIEADDAETRAFLRAHRHLFVPLADLEAARDALRDRIAQAKLDANPLYIDLDEEESAAGAAEAEQRLEELRARRAEAEARLDRSSHVSADGRYQLIVVRTGFAKTDAARGKELIRALEAIRAEVMADPASAGAEVGFTAGVASSVVEHEALIRGIVLSSVVTALLVALVLLLYLRSVRLLIVLTFALMVGVTVSFGVAALTVGHLNAATAFLGAIIAGNGVNYGILLLARYLEERREHAAPAAMAAAVHGTMRPTIVASLGAAIAYGSLAVTSFRGFADFAIIGGVGMIVCWIASFVIVPALVLRFAPRTKVTTGDPWLGGWIARILGFRRAGVVVALTAAIAVATGAIAWRFIADDPYEYDTKELRSSGDDADEVRRWLAIADREFGRGIAGQTFIGADRPEQVPQIVDALRRIDDHVPEERRTIGKITSILDVVPPDQPEKLAVLGEIGTILDDDALEALTDEERAELDALRPPPGLTAITPERLPEELQVKLREKDGRIGLLVGVRPYETLDEWNGHDLIRFASAVRRLELASGETVTTSGAQVIFADILAQIRADGPRVVAAAAAALLLMVVLVVGLNVRAFAVLTATTLGSVGLIAVCALLDIKVTFLDFVALPITLGLGVDYAINVAHRHHHEEDLDPVETLRTSGAAVFLCSLTTVIGYGSLLVSDNLAIRGFGTAALIGELTCVLTALVVVPAIVTLRKPRRDDGIAIP